MPEPFNERFPAIAARRGDARPAVRLAGVHAMPGVINMPTIIAFHEADDVDHWLHSPKRQEIFGPMGITGQLFTDPANSNHVGLILNVPDMEAFQEVMQSEEAADAMRFGGVRPETLVILDQASDHL